MKRSFVVISFLLLFVLTGCKDDEKKKENVCVKQGDSCEDGKICEMYENGQLQCAAPVWIKGTVTSSMDGAAIAGAHVQARDANGAATGTSAVTAQDGSYSVQVSAVRASDGSPVQTEITLAAQAQGYDLFPTAVRPALPVDLSTSQPDAEANGNVVINAITAIVLMPLPGDVSQNGLISGDFGGDDCAGVLVVAESDSAGYVGYSNADCEYTIFNVPAGTYTVSGYAAGVQGTSTVQTVAAGAETTGADLVVSTAPLSTITGMVSIVNAPGDAITSVILVVESTFIEGAAQVQVPRGLRADNVTGAFSFENVPDGKYVVLAAYENDNLVRDPDVGIGGTSIVHIEVPNPTTGNTIALSEGFKVTEALNVVSPGAEVPEQVTADNLTFVWMDDSSEKSYDIKVIDALGNQIWETTIDGVSGGDGTASVPYGGPALTPGMYYQFKVISINNSGNPISTTEDLKGVFYL
ncbi:MAG: hypothetical protein JXR76_07615 [Deltaproteobacteria bacterium]|nr:hypothetical protein [Deltaproteobacteria bacterium]